MNSVTRSADVVVVGAGIIGLTTALELAGAGLKVCVIERGRLGQEASWAAGGILSPLPPDDPVPEIRNLLDQSLALFPDYCASLLEQTGINPEFWRCGAVMVRGQLEHWYPDIAQVRNPRLLKALFAALKLKGVDLIENLPALGWQIDNGRLTGVLTSQGSVACKKAVLAAGAWSGAFSQVGVRPVKGQMLLLRGRPGLLDHICISDKAYVIPRRDGHILVGSTLEEAGFDTATTLQARDYLLACAAELWPKATSLEIQQQWAGFRPCIRGAMPFIGSDERISGLFINTGHYRLGVTLSLASAQLSAAQVVARW